jgi:hypothetical protein
MVSASGLWGQVRQDAAGVRRHRLLIQFLQGRGRDLLTATESDLTAYQALRTEIQDRPVGDAAWGKEAQLINQLSVIGRVWPPAAQPAAGDPQGA